MFISKRNIPIEKNKRKEEIMERKNVIMSVAMALIVGVGIGGFCADLLLKNKYEKTNTEGFTFALETMSNKPAAKNVFKQIVDGRHDLKVGTHEAINPWGDLAENMTVVIKESGYELKKVQ